MHCCEVVDERFGKLWKASTETFAFASLTLVQHKFHLGRNFLTSCHLPPKPRYRVDCLAALLILPITLSLSPLQLHVTCKMDGEGLEALLVPIA
jgi:hypothetical protein